jgi:hypothetical protein
VQNEAKLGEDEMFGQRGGTATSAKRADGGIDLWKEEPGGGGAVREAGSVRPGDGPGRVRGRKPCVEAVGEA